MAAESTLAGRKLVQGGLSFRDLDRARSFLPDTLGLPLFFGAGNMLFFQVGEVGLSCRDLDRARSFYRDTLGLPLLLEAGNMLFFQLEGMRLMVGLAHNPERPVGGSIVYFDAPDMDALGAALEARGVTFTGSA